MNIRERSSHQWILGKVTLLTVVASLGAVVGYSLARPDYLEGLWLVEPKLPRRATEPNAVIAGVGSLGRLEPGEGVVRVAGPPRPVAVVDELYVKEGDEVTQGQVLAVLMGLEVKEAELQRAIALANNAETEVARNQPLHRNGSISDTAWREVRLARDTAAADVKRLQAEIELYKVKSPLEGRVLKLVAHSGERVGPEGILELADTSQMYVVAEVYETDIGRIRVGQPATVRSPALADDLIGHVARIGLFVGKKDVLSTDPVADADARVVEVRLILEDSSDAAHLTNLRVDVVFHLE